MKFLIFFLFGDTLGLPGSGSERLFANCEGCVCCQVHKVIAGSLADRDGRIQKGDRVLSINGRSTKGVSHREALSILKVGFLYIFKNTSLNCK